MRAEFRDRINFAIGLFSLLFVAALWTRANSVSGRPMPQVLGTLALVPLVWAFWSYAESKGQLGAWGFVGLIPFAGVIALLLLPDKTRPCRSMPVPADRSEPSPSSPPA